MGTVIEVGDTDRLIAAMREWLLAEGEWRWRLVDPDDEAVLKAIDDVYTGGVDQFLAAWNAEHGIGVGASA